MLQPIEITKSKTNTENINEALKLAESVMSDSLTYRVEIRLVPDGLNAGKTDAKVFAQTAVTA